MFEITMKVGNDRWYEKYILIADELYDQHLLLLKKERLL